MVCAGQLMRGTEHRLEPCLVGWNQALLLFSPAMGVGQLHVAGWRLRGQKDEAVAFFSQRLPGPLSQR